MAKTATPKLDQIRAMREERYKDRKPITPPLARLREDVASIPVKKAKKPRRATP